MLAGALVALTLLAMGPLRALDERWHRHWGRDLAPGMQPLFQEWLDRIAGQAVCLPVLAGVGLWLAWRHRSWQPVLCVVAAEVAFYVGVGGLKVLLARPAPGNRAPHAKESGFFEGGLVDHGWHGISYPSGHAAEAVLVYGTAAYLVVRWTGVGSRSRRLLVAAVALVAVNAVAVSFWLGWHWATDLAAGSLAGGLLLRMLIWADRREWWVVGRSVAAWTTPRRPCTATCAPIGTRCSGSSTASVSTTSAGH